MPRAVSDAPGYPPTNPSHTTSPTEKPNPSSCLQFARPPHFSQEPIVLATSLDFRHLTRNNPAAHEAAIRCHHRTGMLTQYLLVPQTRNNKSTFLELAGYHLGNADLREQILPLEATDERENQFGNYHEISGPLRGPNTSCFKSRQVINGLGTLHQSRLGP